jgi:hypothetical protein
MPQHDSILTDVLYVVCATRDDIGHEREIFNTVRCPTYLLYMDQYNVRWNYLNVLTTSVPHALSLLGRCRTLAGHQSPADH